MSERFALEGAIKEIKRLRAEVERLTNGLDEAHKNSQFRMVNALCEESHRFRDRAESAEARVAELEHEVACLRDTVTLTENLVAKVHRERNEARKLVLRTPTSLPDLTFDADDPAPCVTCGGKTEIPSWAGPDWPIDCPDCRAKEEK